MFRRNYTGLLALNSGVTMAAEGVRMNGIGKNGVSYNVDGTDAGGNPEGRYSSNYLQPNLIDIMSIEAIQEVHTIKGVPPAEYGNMVAGQVNLLSRSGANQWHGSLFENFRAEELDARHQRLTEQARPDLQSVRRIGRWSNQARQDLLLRRLRRLPGAGVHHRSGNAHDPAAAR